MRRKAAPTCSSSRGSHSMAVPLSPTYCISATERPVMYTVASASISPRATPRPTPRLAPVTSATLPLSVCIGVSSRIERAGVRARYVAAEWRAREVLRDQLHLLGDLVAADARDQLQRLVDSRRDAAAGYAVAVDDEARVAGGDFDLAERLQAWDEGPVRRRLVAVEQAGARQQQRTFADRRDIARAGSLPPKKGEEGGVLHHHAQPVRTAARHPQQVERLFDVIEPVVRGQDHAVSRPQGVARGGDQLDLNAARRDRVLLPVITHPVENLVRRGDVHQVYTVIDGDADVVGVVFSGHGVSFVAV